jgi:hypothetical protein
MRSGHNPAKFVQEVAHPARVTVVLLTHIPALEGYHAGALEVLQASLRSLLASTTPPFDLLVFDNASGPETVAFLQAEFAAGRIQYLFLSDRNLGKGGAWDILFPAAPGEIIAYADSDVYFHPGWLPAGLAVLETFPRVGMVTCRPMRTLEELSSATADWAQAEPLARLERGQSIPWATFREHDVGLGQPEEEVRRRYEETQDQKVVFRGQSALIGAVHWQFLGFRETLRQMVPLDLPRPMSVRKFDERLNAAGLLRLMTTEAFVRHIGNRLPPDLADAVSALPVLPKPGPVGIADRLLSWSPVRRVLLGLHNAIFRWYFGPGREGR